MLKITGGEHRGRNLRAPAGLGTRPTASKVREALFNILGPAVVGARLCDLFAGSGALGLEALSRGAEFVLFVERSLPVIKVLRANIEHLGLEDRAKVFRADAAAAGPSLAGFGQFDLVLADPPYEKGFVNPLVGLVCRTHLLRPGGLLVVEHSPAERPGEAPDLTVCDRRVYGQTELTMLTSSCRQGRPIL